jgi:hypothetical protein
MEPNEAAAYVGVKPKLLLAQAKQRRIAYIRTSPRKLMFDQNDLDAWIASWQRRDVLTKA